MRRWETKAAAAGVALLVLGSAAGTLGQTCDAYRNEPLVPTNLALCRSLAEAVRNPLPDALGKYEATLSLFFNNWCHRDTEAGWVRDKFVRDTGPYTASRLPGAGQPWAGKYHGTHNPVVIWYSPEAAEWLLTNRPAGGHGNPDAPPFPHGSILVKEMFPQPAAACADHPPENLWPTSGAAIMVRDADASHDGWFWGWYGWPGSVWSLDWPAPVDNRMPNMGFGQYCMNCHASADKFSFADSRNMEGQPGDPLVFLSQDFFATQYLGGSASQDSAGSGGASIMGSRDIHEAHAKAGVDASPLAPSRPDVDPDLALVVLEALPADGATPVFMPSQTYDNVWMPADGPSPTSQFLTSDQCLGCHDAGSTGLAYDMTAPDPDSDKLFNFSPYGTWRSSPMGLGGRDPIFYAQLASETQTFQPDDKDFVETTCLGCHGIQGQRQYQIDTHLAGDGCGTFDRGMVDAIPWPAGNPSAPHAKFGALARDGIACMSCHHMVLGEQASAEAAQLPQNACVLERQEQLNPNETGFARTFTGSFLVGDPAALIGPFENPKQVPMEHVLGIKPVEDVETIRSSEVCGTCHTVHLPVMQNGQVISRFYEQATYPEWAFSAYRTGYTVDGPLPQGPGSLAESCQGCHMPSQEDGRPFRSRIASIQEFSNFPEAEHRLPKDDIDLEQRDGFAKHTLVGLNLFLVEMFKQFPDVLGFNPKDPMMVDLGVEPLDYTARAISEQAANTTATIRVLGEPTINDGILGAAVKIDSRTGHKFPSGVGFRRAFLTFEVLDSDGEVLWASGRTDDAGIIVDENGSPIVGELWWDGQCNPIAPEQRLHQPHYQVVTSQNQAQIYQELVSTPPENATAEDCTHDAEPAGHLTTGFLNICTIVKENRLPPPGYLGYEERVEIAEALGAHANLAADAGYKYVGDDPDYTRTTQTGGDTVRYEVAVSELSGTPASVRATLSYQATPPFYLQDRFCTATGLDTERLAYLAAHLQLDGTRAEDWSLKVVETGEVPVAE